MKQVRTHYSKEFKIKAITVKNNDFISNATDGAYFKSINYITFVNNTILLGSPTSTTTSGLYLNVCKFYSVQNNTITGMGGYPSSMPSYGFVANYSDFSSITSGGNHLINRNKIDNCWFAIGAQSKNAINNVGLKLKCNKMGLVNANTYDVAMQGANPAVDLVQGSSPNNSTPTELAKLVGNKYSANCQGYSYGTKWYVEPASTNVFNHASNYDAACIISPQPSCSNYQAALSTFPYNFLEAQCPDKYEAPKNNTSLNTDISNAKTAIGVAIDFRASKIDGGNTNTLIAVVNGISSVEDIHIAVQNNSPYLSDQVLSAYFTRTLIPTANILDVHNRNKPVTDSVWASLLSAGFSSTIMATLTEQQNSSKISARRILEMDLDEANYNLSMAYREKISYFLNDTLMNSIDSAMTTVAISNFSDSKCQLIASQIANPNSTITAATIDDIHGGSSFVDQFCQFQKIAITANQSPEKWDILKTNSSLKTSLEAIATNTSNKGCYLAQAPLEFVFNNYNTHPYLVPNQSSGSRAMVAEAYQLEAENKTISVTEGVEMKIYPNPTNGDVNVFLKVDQESGNNSYKLELENNLGEIIFSKFIEGNKNAVISTSGILNGLYILRIVEKEKFEKESKLIIIK